MHHDLVPQPRLQRWTLDISELTPIGSQSGEIEGSPNILGSLGIFTWNPAGHKQVSKVMEYFHCEQHGGQA